MLQIIYYINNPVTSLEIYFIFDHSISNINAYIQKYNIPDNNLDYHGNSFENSSLRLYN